MWCGAVVLAVCCSCVEACGGRSFAVIHTAAETNPTTSMRGLFYVWLSTKEWNRCEGRKYLS